MTRGIPVDVQDCSASAKAVYLLLDAEGAMPQQKIRSLTGLSEDTTRRALGELVDVEAALERPDPNDGRRQRYVLTGALEVA